VAPACDDENVMTGDSPWVASEHFLRASSSDVLADQPHIKSHEKFRVSRVSGPSSPYLHFGDSVAFVPASTGGFLHALGSADDFMVGKASTRGTCGAWRLVNPANPSSTGMVRVNDEVAFRSCHGRYMYRQSSSDVRAHLTTISAAAKWRLLSLPLGAKVD
jgi:hypothetical protein